METGQYWLEVTNDEGCSYNDTFNVSFTNELFDADFLLPSEGLIDEPVFAVDVSWPLADSIKWLYDEDSIIQEQSIFNQEIITFPYIGTYTVTMIGYFEGCEMPVSKDIQIFDDPDQLLNPSNLEIGYGFILESIIFPNPSDGNFSVRMILSDDVPLELWIFNTEGQLLDKTDLGGAFLHEHQYSFNNLIPGVYTLIAKTDYDWKYFNFVIE